MITIVLPTRGLDGKYFKLVMESYNKYLNIDCEFIIITNDINVEDYIKKYKFKFRIIKDDELLDCSRFNTKDECWYKQQLLKLLISKKVETDLYMILDDDLFLTREITLKDIYVNDKIRYSSEKYEELSTKNHSSLNWWNGSCKLLSIEMIKNDNLMSVTPQIFITNIVLELLIELKMMYGNFINKFIEYGASEYSLYWLYILQTRNENKYSNKDIHWWVPDENVNVLDYIYDVKELITKVCNGFKNNSSYFTVIQSYLNIDESLIEEIVKQLI